MIQKNYMNGYLVGTPVNIVGPKPKIDRVLRRGTVGPDVVRLQLRLVELGYHQERAKGTSAKIPRPRLGLFNGITDCRKQGLLMRKLCYCLKCNLNRK
ncbi:MAG TPA: hypothetical protein VN379_09885 [Sporomusa sp.]|nr:hypothetical protein [Sporomusa sp.]